MFVITIVTLMVVITITVVIKLVMVSGRDCCSASRVVAVKVVLVMGWRVVVAVTRVVVVVVMSETITDNSRDEHRRSD